METATIAIKRSSVLADMKVKSYAETARIADATERYLVTLGKEKEQEAQQCITDAAAEVTALLLEFVSTASTDSQTADDTYETGSTDIVYTLGVYEAPTGFAQNMARAIHDYIVDSALAKFYISVSMNELSGAHNAKLASEVAVIKRTLYYRPMP